MTLRPAILGLSIIGFSAATADAQGLFSFDPAEGGFIISGYIGSASQSGVEFSGVQTPEAGVPGAVDTPANIEADFDDEITFGGTIGYQLPFKYWKYFHPRLELEITTFEADVSAVSYTHLTLPTTPYV